MKEKKEVNIEIGSRIKRTREEAGLTQERFAELIGMGTKNVSAIERGAVGVSLSALQKICRVLAVSSDEILFENNRENDVQILTSRLKRLSPMQFGIVNDIVNKLMEAFVISKK